MATIIVHSWIVPQSSSQTTRSIDSRGQWSNYDYGTTSTTPSPPSSTSSIITHTSTSQTGTPCPPGKATDHSSDQAAIIALSVICGLAIICTLVSLCLLCSQRRRRRRAKQLKMLGGALGHSRRHVRNLIHGLDGWDYPRRHRFSHKRRREHVGQHCSGIPLPREHMHRGDRSERDITEKVYGGTEAAHHRNPAFYPQDMPEAHIHAHIPQGSMPASDLPPHIPETFPREQMHVYDSAGSSRRSYPGMHQKHLQRRVSERHKSSRRHGGERRRRRSLSAV